MTQPPTDGFRADEQQPRTGGSVSDLAARAGTADAAGVLALDLRIQPQPCDTTCGPTCLHAIYQYLGDTVSLSQVVAECPRLEEGGTLAALLGTHALRRGYQATIYSYNLRIFDPTWFAPDAAEPIVDLSEKLREQWEHKRESKLRRANNAYREFLAAGGRVRMQDLTRQLLRQYLDRGIPLLAGASATYLYHEAREFGPQFVPDDVRGEPVGHFVVLRGYNRTRKTVLVADPYLPNPLAPEEHHYEIGVERVLCAILLGILTYDANLLVLEPKP